MRQVVLMAWRSNGRISWDSCMIQVPRLLWAEMAKAGVSTHE